jgi:amino acid adenylation domain-containing protein
VSVVELGAVAGATSAPRLTRLGARSAPLSYAQERLWFIDAAAAGAPTYNVPLFVEWTEQVDARALAAAMRAVAERHEVLRTTYELRDGRPVQVVGEPAAAPVEVVDLARVEDARRHARAEAERRAREGFDLAGGAPLRCVLWQGLPGGDAMLLNVHHIAIDGWSLAVLFEDLAAAYDAAVGGRAPALAALAVQYADYAAWERAADRAPAARRLVAERAAELVAVPGDLTLADAPARAAGPEPRNGAEHVFELPAELWAAVRDLARSTRCTPFVVLLAAYQAVLARWSGRDEFVVGTVAAERPHPALESLVGFFVNTVPLRCAPRPELTFRALCGQVRGEAYGALGRRIPYDQLAAETAAARGDGRGGLVEIGFALQNMPAPRIATPRWRPPVQLATGTAKFDMFLIFDVTGERLVGRVEYDSDRYTDAVASELAGNLRALLSAAVADPDRPLRALPISAGGTASGVLAGERRDLVAERLGSATPAMPVTSVLDLVAAQLATADPDGAAVTCAGTAMSWRELDGRAWAVAGALAERGIGVGDLVPVVAARGGALVAAWLGVLRSGAAYVPLSVDTPPGRLAHIVEHVGASSLLVDAGSAALLDDVDLDVVCLDDLPHPAASTPSRVALTGGEPAVVIYTSGTTGRPKGVVVPHRGLLNTALWWADDARLTPADRVLCTFSSSFDGATFDAFRSLMAGSTLVFADDVERRDPPALLRLLRGPRGATVASMTPSLLRASLDADDAGDAGALRLLHVGGEALPRALAQCCVARWDVPMVNIYGPTEASCISTFGSVDPSDPRPPAIGVPLPNTRAYVLGPDQEELPTAVAGELYVAGRGVASGYLGEPELTAAAFLPDVHGGDPDARMYRTGDRVVLRPDNLLECGGRVDDQVKVLGNRIEPDEVAALLVEHPAVRSAAVAVVGEPKRLVGYVVCDGGEPPTRTDIVRPLLRWLPAAVLPASVYAVDALPLTGNDKIDFAALAAMHERPLPDAAAALAGPLTAHERHAAQLFAGALAERDHGAGAPSAEALVREASFFALGGHSLLSVRMLAAADERFGVRVTLRDFLADPTIAGLARLLEAGSPAPEELPAAERPADADGRYEASSVQRRLWLVDRVAELRSAYLVPAVLELGGSVERETVREALARVLERHPALRSRFELDRRDRRVVYRTDAPAPAVTVTDATGWTPAEVAERVSSACWTPFDLAAEAPARAELIACDGERTIVVLCAHHIVADGQSQQLLLDELAEVYAALREARPALLSEPVHPASVPGTRPGPELDARVSAVVDALRGAPTDVDLPRSQPRPAVQRMAAASAATTLDARLTKRLRRVSADLGCTTFMTAAALLGVAIARFGDQRDVLFAFPWAGRDEPASQTAVGMFVNTLVLRVDLRGEPTWRELLRRVRAASLHPDRDLSRPPLTPVYLAAQDADPRPPALGPGVLSRCVALPDLRVKYELELTACDRADRLTFAASYAVDLIDPKTVTDLLAALSAGARNLAADRDAPALKETA